MSRSITILFTSVGRRVELVRSFRDACARLGVVGRFIGTDVDPLAPAMQLMDGAVIAPPWQSPDYVTFLTELCARERVEMVFPLIDPDIAILSGMRESLATSGTDAVVVPLEAARATADKLLTRDLFSQAGVRQPRTYTPEELDVVVEDFPLIVKPRFGSASAHVHRVNDARELAFVLPTVPRPIIQQLMAGPEITSDVLCSSAGGALGVVSRMRLQVRAGEVVKAVTMRDASVEAGCLAIARVMEARGPITVQCMMHDGEPHFTEVNPRFGGGFPLSIAAGLPGPALLISERLGLGLTSPPIGSHQVGMYMTRFDESFFLTAGDLASDPGPRL